MIEGLFFIGGKSVGGRGSKSPDGGDKRNSYGKRNNFVDNSDYAKEHKAVVDYVKKQTGVDLNKYRDGDGTNPNMTTYWEKSGDKVAVDWKRMPTTDKQTLMNFAATAYGGGTIEIEQGGAWVYFISRKKRR